MSKEGGVRWRRTDDSILLVHCSHHESLVLVYGRTYTTREGYAFSETNQLIHNLKKPCSASPQELRYKKKAIKQFAAEVTTLFEDSLTRDRQYVLVPVPPSKTRSHPDYDDRIEQVAQQVSAAIQNLLYLPLLYATEDGESFHTRSDSRDPDEIHRLMAVDKSQILLCPPRATIIVLDDILTSGAHFSAAYRHLQEHCPESIIHGVFWANAQSPDLLF